MMCPRRVPKVWPKEEATREQVTNKLQSKVTKAQRVQRTYEDYTNKWSVAIDPDLSERLELCLKHVAIVTFEGAIAEAILYSEKGKEVVSAQCKA